MFKTIISINEARREVREVTDLQRSHRGVWLLCCAPIRRNIMKAKVYIGISLIALSLVFLVLQIRQNLNSPAAIFPMDKLEYIGSIETDSTYTMIFRKVK